jgi:hypothetical protein
MVFVLDRHKKPLMPCTEKRARLLLSRGRAVVDKIAPFTIRIKGRTLEESKIQSLNLKLKPGAKETGLAILREGANQVEAIFLCEIRHKPGVKDRLNNRRNLRSSRRNRKTRYRKPRFENRIRKDGWLPPSLEARVKQSMNAVNKLTKLVPIAFITYEHAKFDTQLLQNPEISGLSTNKESFSATKSGNTCWRNGAANALTAVRPVCLWRSSILYPDQEAVPTGYPT